MRRLRDEYWSAIRRCVYLGRIEHRRLFIQRESWMDDISMNFVREKWKLHLGVNQNRTVKAPADKQRTISTRMWSAPDTLKDFFFVVATYLQVLSPKKECDSQFLINGAAAIVDCSFISGAFCCCCLHLNPSISLLTTKKKYSSSIWLRSLRWELRPTIRRDKY